MKMFVNRTLIKYKSDVWECTMNTVRKACFARVEPTGDLNMEKVLILSNDVLAYLNNSSINILFDPRRLKEYQDQLSIYNKRHCEDCGYDMPLYDFYEKNGKPTNTCKKCYNKESPIEIKRLIRQKSRFH